MPFFVISILCQVALVIHIVKTSRNTTWIWIVVMLPFAGAIAYFVLEVLPELLGSKRGRSATRLVSNAINPNKDLKKAASDFSVADTVENSMRLADELMEKGNYSEANTLYKKCLSGLHKTDPFIMFRLSKSEFEMGNYNTCKEVLDDLIKHNPDFKNAEAHLLYARAHEHLNNVDAAKHEYEHLYQYYPGPEAAYRYANLCWSQGDTDLANQLLAEILKKSKTSGGHYNSIHKEWIKKAKQGFDR